MTDGAKRIAAERDRQINEEGWDAKHDEKHMHGSLTSAAICYAASAVEMPIRAVRKSSRGESYMDPWPWEHAWDKRDKHGRIRKLEIAGALIAAEIDRLLASDPEETSG